jgi:hypothetical protein
VGLLNVTVRRHRLGVPGWLADLTGMTDAKRESGVAFPGGLAQLAAFCEGAELWIFSGDWDVLLGNCREHGVAFPFPHNVGRAKALLRDKGVTAERFAACGFHEVCSGGMGRVLGIELPEDGSVGAHDAAYDARSLAHAVYRLKQME